MRLLPLIFLLSFSSNSSEFLMQNETIVLNNGQRTEINHQHLWFYKPNVESATSKQRISERICERCYRHEKIVSVYSNRIIEANKKWESLLKASNP